MVQFGLGYLIMLLAMYYIGYIIICILLGAFVGHFVTGWDDFAAGYVPRKRSPDAESGPLLTKNTDAAPDVTKGNSCV